jgi:hypothetical protein
MQERVRCGGGTWSVTSGAGMGTMVVSQLPLVETPEPQPFAHAG